MTDELPSGDFVSSGDNMLAIRAVEHDRGTYPRRSSAAFAAAKAQFTLSRGLSIPSGDKHSGLGA
jgi:hypothetical protein